MKTKHTVVSLIGFIIVGITLIAAIHDKEKTNANEPMPFKQAIKINCSVYIQEKEEAICFQKQKEALQAVIDKYHSYGEQLQNLNCNLSPEKCKSLDLRRRSLFPKKESAEGKLAEIARQN